MASTDNRLITPWVISFSLDAALGVAALALDLRPFFEARKEKSLDGSGWFHGATVFSINFAQVVLCIFGAVLNDKANYPNHSRPEWLDFYSLSVLQLLVCTNVGNFSLAVPITANSYSLGRALHALDMERNIAHVEGIRSYCRPDCAGSFGLSGNVTITAPSVVLLALLTREAQRLSDTYMAISSSSSLPCRLASVLPPLEDAERISLVGRTLIRHISFSLGWSSEQPS